MFLPVAVVLLVIWILIMRWKSRKFRQLAGQLKSSLTALPFIGHSYLLIGNKEERMKGFQRMGRDAIEAKGTSAIWIASKLYIMVADPEVADVILKNCLDKDDIISFFRLVTGNGSIFAPVSEWRPRRKFLAPTFSMKKLSRYVEVFSAQNRIMAEKLKQAVGQGRFSIWNAITTYSMDAICGTTLGVQIKAQENPDHPILVGLQFMFHIAAKRICSPWLHFDCLFKKLPMYQMVVKHKVSIYEFIDKIIKDRRKLNENDHQSQENRNELEPLVKLLLESAGAESDVVIREECLMMIGAATDTSAVGIGFIFLMLTKYPEIQEKVYQELKEVFGESNRPVEADDLHRLKYIEAVIKETLRLYPPAPMIVRKIDKEVKLPSGVVLVPGCGATINIWAVHRNPAYWGEDADEFRPERFLNSTLKHPAAFLPFSFGLRNCIGNQYAMMSIKTVMASVLRQYRLVPASPDAKDGGPLRVEFDIMMRHVYNYCVGIEPRK